MRKIDFIFLIFIVLLYLCYKHHINRNVKDTENDSDGGLLLADKKEKFIVLEDSGDLNIYDPVTEAFTTNALTVDTDADGTAPPILVSNNTSTTINNLVNSSGLINAKAGLEVTNLDVSGNASIGALTANGGLNTTGLTSKTMTLTGGLNVSGYATLAGKTYVTSNVTGETNTLNIFTNTNGQLLINPLGGSRNTTNLGGRNITIGHGAGTTSITFVDNTLPEGVTLTAAEINRMKAILQPNDKTFIRNNSHLDIYTYAGYIGSNFNLTKEVKHTTNSGGYQGYLCDYSGSNSDAGFLLRYRM